jgi:hypothetical protein
MRSYFWVGILFGSLGLGTVFSQSNKQLAFHYGMGRTYSFVDLTQATSDNLEAAPGLAVPLGLEMAWLPGPHVRISAGFSITAYNTRFENAGGVWNFSRGDGDEIGFASVPVEITYRLFEGPTMKKSFSFIVGASYDLITSSAGSSGSSSGRFANGMEVGSTRWMTYQTTADFNFSLRFGIGQEWSLGKRDRISIQVYALYVMGLMPIWEGNLLYWDQTIPEGYNWDVPLTDVMGTPQEAYNSITSNGTYFTVGWKVFYNLNQE